MGKKFVAAIIVLLGLMLGSFIGELVEKIPVLEWLNYGKKVGIPNFSMDFYAVNFNLGLMFNCTIATMIGLIFALIIYFKFVK